MKVLAMMTLISALTGCHTINVSSSKPASASSQHGLRPIAEVRRALSASDIFVFAPMRAGQGGPRFPVIAALDGKPKVVSGVTLKLSPNCEGRTKVEGERINCYPKDLPDAVIWVATRLDPIIDVADGTLTPIRLNSSHARLDSANRTLNVKL